MKKHIPNFITCLNVFAGCIGVYYAFSGNYQAAFCMMLLAALFDFCDGFTARLLKAYSAIGKELDSLADMISFGLLPGALLFHLLSSHIENGYLPFIAFIIPVFSALRLAKFNVDERQSSSFIGVPTPANAIFWGGLFLGYADVLQTHPYLSIALACIMSYLLVSELPLFSLKFKNLKWKGNEAPFVFLGGSVVLLALFTMKAFAWIVGWYIVVSVVKLLIERGKKAL